MSDPGESTPTPETAANSRKRPAPSVTNGTYLPRKRAQRACQSCRRRKSKCDNGRPSCGFCVDIGATCTYQEAPAEASLSDPGILAVLDRINHVVSLLENGTYQPMPSSTIVSPPAPEYPTGSYIGSAEIPSRCNYSCRLVSWPIFKDFHLENSLDGLFSRPDPHQSHLQSTTQRGIAEEDVSAHLHKFLVNIHPKNPVLDHGVLAQHARQVTELGFAWDGPTCLVLMACALGVISQPFRRILVSNPPEEDSDLALADAYYTAARKRLALLDVDSLLYLQCKFLSGVYEMHSLRPLAAWYAFHSVCTAIPVYQQRSAGQPQSRNLHNLEQRIFWSSLKSERELSSELNTPSARTSDINFPDHFPMPPDSPSPSSASTPTSTPTINQSWYYYLTEISTRCTIDRILTTFYAHPDKTFLSLPSPEMLHLATEFESHLHLSLTTIPKDLHYNPSDPQDHELPYFVSGRLICAQECLFRPFLFRVIHADQEQEPEVVAFARRCLEACCAGVRQYAIQHRHHGSWMMARTAFRGGMCLLAAVRSGRGGILPGEWRECVGIAMQVLDFWGEKGACDVLVLGRVLRTVFEGVVGGMQ